MTARPGYRKVPSNPSGESFRLGPALELAGLGVGLTLVCGLMAALPSWFHNLGAFQGLFVLAFAFYALALLRLERYAALPRVGLAVFGVALAARVALLPATPSLSADLYRYLWEGRVVVHGGNPYRQSPDDPGLAALRDEAHYAPINHKQLATIYPPLAMAGFALVARIAPTVMAFKLWVIAHDLALVLLLLAWARRRGASATAVIAYAWNPLVLVEYAGTGHFDPTGIFWLILALYLARSRPLASGLALVAGTMVKLAPALAAPFLMRDWPWRARVATAVALALGIAVFLGASQHSASGLRAYWGSWRNNEGGFYLLERGLGSFDAARWAAIVVVLAGLAWAWLRAWSPAGATRLGIRLALLASPVLHPWYLGWALAFEPLALSWPWILLSLTAILNYGVFATPAAGRSFHLPLAWRMVEYGIPLIVGAAIAWRRRVRRLDQIQEGV